MTRILMIGTGYVGLVSGACMADFGNHVICYDIDQGKIDTLSRGAIPFYEPGLKELVERNRDAGRLRFSTDLDSAMAESNVVVIAVGTPELPDGSADLSAVYAVAKAIGERMNGYKVVVQKSTVPVGTNRRIRASIAEAAGAGAEFDMVANPEFLREGSAIEDFMKPDRVVVGTRDPKAAQIMLDVYSPLRVADVPFVITNVESAELIKYASNGFLATKISFINEVATLCEALGANVEVVARGMGLDKRIGAQFLHPGPGFGGSCFPKDTRAVAQIAHERGLHFRIIESVLEVNTATTARMIDKVRKAFGTLEGKTVAVLGLAFKPETDDIRESPALTIIQGLQKDGAHVRAHDPAAMDASRPHLPGVELMDDPYAAADGADGVVIVTEWNQFRALELDRLKKLLRQPLMVDLRNIYEPEKVTAAGFRYDSIGRPPGSASPLLAQERP